ncbi:MAG: hypothetical protein AAGK22_18375 [Acidobacteriota bacterium]
MTWTLRRGGIAVGVLLLFGLSSALAQEKEQSPTGPQAERFVREARVVAMRSVGRGSSRSRLALLRSRRETRRAIWKTVGSDDPYARNEEGDSYRHEVAAFEVDRLLQLGRVPATASRRVGERTGSLQLWLEEAETVTAEDLEKLNQKAEEQLANILLLRALIGAAPDSDLLVSRSGDLFTTDHASAFRADAAARPESLVRVSQKAFDSLGALERPVVEKRLRRWLSDDELEGVLRRRTELLEDFERRRRSSGDASVFLP